MQYIEDDIVEKIFCSDQFHEDFFIATIKPSLWTCVICMCEHVEVILLWHTSLSSDSTSLSCLWDLVSHGIYTSLCWADTWDPRSPFPWDSALELQACFPCPDLPHILRVWTQVLRLEWQTLYPRIHLPSCCRTSKFE